MSEENIKKISKSDINFAPTFVDHHVLRRLKNDIKSFKFSEKFSLLDPFKDFHFNTSFPKVRRVVVHD